MPTLKLYNDKIRDFCSFLRFSLDDNLPVPDCVERIKWSELLDFARKQSIVSVMFHGMQRIVDHANKPTDDDVLQWYGDVKVWREKSKLAFELSSKVVKNFEIEGFRSCILKGQGNALLYSDPYIRQSGDIDVWVEGIDNDIIRYIHRLSPGAKACYHHIDFPRFKKAAVEVHYRPSFLHNPIYNYRLQKFFTEKASLQFANKVALSDNLGSIFAPTASFNRIYLLSHIANHLLREGIGLRHLCDYYLLLKSYDIVNTDEREREHAILRRCGLMPVARSVAYIMDKVFCLSPDCQIVEPDKRRGRFLLNEIISGGNFGHHDNRLGSMPTTNPFLHNIQRLYRDVRMALFFPSETLCEPFFRLYHYFWRRKHSKI